MVWVSSASGTGSVAVDTAAFATLEGAVEGDRFGSALLAADLDGDGTEDQVVGAMGEEAVWVFQDPVSGALTTTDASGSIAGPGSSSLFGYDLVAGDDDGDGYPDLYVSAPKYSGTATRSGGIWLFHGPISSAGETAASAFIEGTGTNDYAGDQLSGADLDLDGNGDLVFTYGYHYWDGATSRSAAGEADGHVFLGPLAGSHDTDDAEVVIDDCETILLPGDLDGDGWDDIGWADGDLFLASWPGF